MKRSYFDLTGSTGIVTGATSVLGNLLCKALANQGCAVVPVARNEERLQELADRIHEEYDVETYPVRCDIAETDAVEQAVEEIVSHFGTVDILINNAGTGKTAPAEEITDEQFGTEINIDIFGTFRMTRAVAKKAMIPAGYGRIINIASVFGLVGSKFGNSVPYEATKGALVNMTRSLAAEWSTYGITVNCIAPGYFITPYTKDQLESTDFKAYSDLVIPEERYGEEGDIATTVIYLSSPFTSYVTGVTIPVDGGYTAI